MNHSISRDSLRCLPTAAIALLGASLVCSCGSPEFKVKGEIEGGGGKTVVLEKADFHGQWIPVDSTRIASSGSFSISAPAPASPEIYRLSLGERFVYLPVDSIETVTLVSSEAGFGNSFSLDGTPNARSLAAFEKELQQLHQPDSARLADFKKRVYGKYIQNAQGSIVGYYVLTKFHDGKPLYDPADPADAKYYAAVATQFEQYRPGDPHGRMVRQVSLDAMRRQNRESGRKHVVEAQELSVLDICLPDENNKTRKLSETVGKGKPVLLVFSMMNAAESPAFNRKLREVQGRGYEIFHVCFDAGQYEWREAARNLPWTTVLDPNGTSSTALVDYNVTQLPALFIYDASGELISRPASFDEIR